jgi:hypothetical protein
VEKDEMRMASELILVYLVKALNAATNATSQDRVAFAIQVFHIPTLSHNFITVSKH